MILLKSTADYLEIKSKFHPSAEGDKNYNVPLTIIGEKRNITIQAPLALAEDLNPHLDNDIIPAHLFTKKYAISFYRDHAEFSSYPISTNGYQCAIGTSGRHCLSLYHG